MKTSCETALVADNMSSLIILLLAVGCVTSDSRRRYLRTDPDNYAQPDFGSYYSRGARDYAQARTTPSREYAPSNFYLPEQQESLAIPSSPSETRYSNPKASHPSYVPQAGLENSPQAFSPSYVPQAGFYNNPRNSAQLQAGFEYNPLASIPSKASQAPYFDTNPQNPSYYPQAGLENQPQTSAPSYIPKATSNIPRASYPSYFPQEGFENTQPEPVYSHVTYDGPKRSSAGYAPPTYARGAQSQRYVPAPAASPSYAPSVTSFTSPAQGKYVAPIAIVKQSRDDQYDGTFSFGFEGENGIASSANGYVKTISPKEQAQVMQGSYTYTAPDGTPIETRWYADETGFHAEGDHLPVPPRTYK